MIKHQRSMNHHGRLATPPTARVSYSKFREEAISFETNIQRFALSASAVVLIFGDGICGGGKRHIEI